MIIAISRWHVENNGVWYLLLACALAIVVFAIISFLEWRAESPDVDRNTFSIEGKMNRRCRFTNRHLWTEGRKCQREGCETWKSWEKPPMR